MMYLAVMVGKFVKQVVSPSLMMGHKLIPMIQVAPMIVVVSMTLKVTLISTVT